MDQEKMTYFTMYCDEPTRQEFIIRQQLAAAARGARKGEIDSPLNAKIVFPTKVLREAWAMGMSWAKKIWK